MRSCLYECTVVHHRLWPKEHRFNANVFMFYLDLDELETLPQKLFFLSYNRFNIFSFRDEDHLSRGKNLKQSIVEYLQSQGLVLQQPRIQLLTYLRTWGYVFNPVSFYFCFDGELPVCAIAEVGNTFDEMKRYFLNRSSKIGADFFKLRSKKLFYVSPFMNLDIDFEFGLKVPQQKLSISVNDFAADRLILLASITGNRQLLTSWNLLKYAVLFPCIPLKVVGLIHWHAARLWFKRVPFIRKKDSPELQKEMQNLKR